MPNWCNTLYTIKGNKNEIDAIQGVFDALEQLKELPVATDFGKEWLGNVVISLGGDWEKTYCRGSFFDVQREDDYTLTLQTETAWSPMNEVFDFICEKFPTVSYLFSAEECGCGYYLTNDVEGERYPWRYIAECSTDSSGCAQEYFNTLDHALGWLSEMSGYEINSIEDVAKVNDALSEQNPDNFCVIEKFTVIHD